MKSFTITKKSLLVLPLLALLLGGCKGNTWSSSIPESRDSSKEPEPFELYTSRQTIVAGQSITVKLLGDYDKDDVELEVGPTQVKVELSDPISEGRYKIETGPDWGGDFTLTAKSGNQQASTSIRVYGARPDIFTYYGDHDYLYDNPTALDFLGYEINQAFFLLYTQTCNNREAVLATLRLNGVTREYYLATYTGGLTDTYTLNPMDGFGSENQIVVKHGVDQYGRGYFDIKFDQEHSLRVGDAAWHTPTLNDVRICFINEDKCTLGINEEDIINVYPRIGFSYTGVIEYEQFSYTIDAPDGITFGDNVCDISPISMTILVTNTSLIGEKVTLHFHFQYYLFEMDKDFVFYLYDPDDQSVPSVLRTNIVSMYSTTNSGGSRFNAYSLWLPYDETINGYHVRTINFPPINGNEPRVFEYMDWEFTLDASQYQYNGYYFQVTLVSYPGTQTRYSAGTSFGFTYNFLTEEGRVAITDAYGTHRDYFFLHKNAPTITMEN